MTNWDGNFYVYVTRQDGRVVWRVCRNWDDGSPMRQRDIYWSYDTEQEAQSTTKQLNRKLLREKQP